MKYICLVLLLIGCSSQTNEDNFERQDNSSGFINVLENLGDKTTPGYYLIIPVKGCSPCVDEALMFMRTRINNPSITFVLSSNESKVLDLTVSAQEKLASNVILDRGNLLFKEGLIESSLVLLEVDERRNINSKTLLADSLTFNLNKVYEKTMASQSY